MYMYEELGSGECWPFIKYMWNEHERFRRGCCIITAWILLTPVYFVILYYGNANQATTIAMTILGPPLTILVVIVSVILLAVFYVDAKEKYHKYVYNYQKYEKDQYDNLHKNDPGYGEDANGTNGTNDTNTTYIIDSEFTHSTDNTPSNNSNTSVHSYYSLLNQNGNKQYLDQSDLDQSDQYTN